MNKMSFEAGGAYPAHPGRLPVPPWFLRHNAVIVAAGIVVVIGAALAFRGGHAPQYVTASVERGDIQDAVEETGTVNAVRTVQVGAQVSGTIARLYVDFNSRVHRGDLIASIDPALSRAHWIRPSPACIPPRHSWKRIRRIWSPPGSIINATPHSPARTQSPR